MGKVKMQYGEDEAPKQEAEATPVKEESSNLPAPYKPVLGDYIPSMADMRLPRINIVHGVGQLKDDFPVGALVYSQQVTLFEPKLGPKEATPPVEIVVLGWLPIRFAEKVPGGGRGMLVSSEEEVKKAGGTLDYKEWELKRKDGMRRFETLAEAVCMIKQPELQKDNVTQFPFVIDDHRYALGIWGMKGSAFTNGAKTIFTSRKMGCCLEGYPTCSWYASTEPKPFKTADGNATVPVPRFVPGNRTTESFQRVAVNIVSGSEEQGPAEA